MRLFVEGVSVVVVRKSGRVECQVVSKASSRVDDEALPGLTDVGGVV